MLYHVVCLLAGDVQAEVGTASYHSCPQSYFDCYLKSSYSVVGALASWGPAVITPSAVPPPEQRTLNTVNVFLAQQLDDWVHPDGLLPKRSEVKPLTVLPF